MASTRSVHALIGELRQECRRRHVGLRGELRRKWRSCAEIADGSVWAARRHDWAARRLRTEMAELRGTCNTPEN